MIYFICRLPQFFRIHEAAVMVKGRRAAGADVGVVAVPRERGGIEQRPTETEEGRLAITHYHTLQRSEERSLVEFKLETGRKNQIRVHMQDLRHPVVGDLKYGAQTDPIGRVCLHAYRLAFIHPITHEHLQFDSPVPGEFRKLMS